MHRIDASATKLLQTAKACEAAGQYDQAYRLLERCKALITNATDVEFVNAVRAGLWRLAPLWWANLQHDGICFRRCQAQDAAFFRSCFEDSVFRRQFNRKQPWQGDLALALEKSGRLPPIQTGLLMWVIQSGAGKPIGLASMSSIDTLNLRTELSVGFPGEIPPTLGIKAILMMLHFSLVMMPFHKVYAYVYEDNAQALHNTTRLGFVHEGKLTDHFKIDGSGFVTVNQIGLTRSQLHSHAGLKVLAKRKIGQEW